MQDQLPSDPKRKTDKRTRRKGFWLGFLFGLFAWIAIMVSLDALVQQLMVPSAVESDELPSPPFPDVIEPELNWPLTDLQGRAVNLSDFDEKVLFVNLWATWCGPCLMEYPAIKALHDQLEGRDVAFLLITEEDAETVNTFIEENGWDIPVYLSTPEGSPPVFQVWGIPSTFVFDSHRRIVFAHVGPANWASTESIAFFDKLATNADQHITPS